MFVKKIYLVIFYNLFVCSCHRYDATFIIVNITRPTAYINVHIDSDIQNGKYVKLYDST